jgi:opacity protein-like surface antigen
MAAAPERKERLAVHPRRILILAAALIAWAVTPARAGGFISPFVGFNFGGDSANCASLTNCNEKRLDWGASIGTTRGLFGFEEDIAYAPDFFGKSPATNNAVLTVMSNLMIVVPAGPVQPYALVGLGLIRPHVEDVTSLALDKNALGWDIGGGINIFLTHSVGVRGDVRHVRTLQDVTLGLFSNDKLDFWRGSAGLTFRF